MTGIRFTYADDAVRRLPAPRVVIDVPCTCVWRWRYSFDRPYGDCSESSHREKLVFGTVRSEPRRRPCNVYTCAKCLRVVPGCFGAADDLPDICDSCWGIAHAAV